MFKIRNISKKYSTKHLLLPSVLCLALSACGGGGGDSSAAQTPAPTTPETPAPPTAPDSRTPEVESALGVYLVDLADNVIIPGYQNLFQSAESLVSASNTFCSINTPSRDDLTVYQQSWREFNQQWQTIQFVRVGPITDDNREFRIQFFPDNNDAVNRGVSNLLLEQQVVTAELVAMQNVGGQGIPALELLLFSEEPDASILSAADRAKRCEVSQAIANNLLNMSTDLNQAWQTSGDNFREQFIGGTGVFTSVRDAVEEITTNWIQQLEIVKDEKVLFPLGTNAPGLPEIVEHVLSDESLSSISTNLQAFSAIYTAGEGQGFDDILIMQLEQDTIAQQVTDAIDANIATIDAIQNQFDSFPAALSNEAGRTALNDLIEDIRVLRDVLSTGFVQALDINIGFNSNDGD
jgi:predicted lipoprotein